jgi:hypothetical protein
MEILMIAEAGVLERQSLLLCESLRRFGGRYAESQVTLLQPRREKPISPLARRRFEALGAQIVEMAIVSPCPEYGTSFRVFACAEYERTSSADSLVFMDSDMVVLAEPDWDLQGADIAARPVDEKGMCTTGDGDPKDAYWRKLCEICGVDYGLLPWVATTVDRVRVRASYNGGLTVVKTKSGIYQKTADFFLRSIRANLMPWPDRSNPFPAGHGMVDVRGGRLWGSAQAAFSIAGTALGLNTRILSPSLNYPLHMHAKLFPEIRSGALPPISIIHYHHVFRGAQSENPLFLDGTGFPSDAIEWLWKNKDSFA